MLAGVWFLYYCFGLVIASVAPLVDTIVRDLQISLSTMGRILGAWQLVYLFSAIPLGIAIDRFGLRASLTVAALIIAMSALLRGIATDGMALWVAVAIFGLGGPLVSIGAPKVIASWFESDERGMAMGIYMTGPALGTVTALALTNSVLMPWLDHNWRQVFYIVALVVFASAVVWLAISSAPVSRQAHNNRTRGGGLQVFAKLLRIPVVLVILVMSIGIFTYNHGLSNWLPEILRSGGMSAVDAGYWAAIPTLTGVVSSLLIPRLATPERRFTILIALFVCAFMAVWFIGRGSGGLLVSGLMMQGFARGAMMTIAILVLMETRAVGAQNMGVAGGLFFTAAEVGGVLGPVGIGLLADRTDSFDTALSMLSYVCVALVLLAVLIQRLERQQS
jgi:cyanate permease